MNMITQIPFASYPVKTSMLALTLGLLLQLDTSLADNQVTQSSPIESSAHRELEEILVTANRRETALQELSMSVSVLDGNVLHDAGARQFEDYVSLIPSLSFGKAVGFNKLTLRGISSGSLGEHQPAVGLYLDETPIPQTQSGFESHPDPYLLDIARIEVLRGPQGTLYGAGAMGGVVKIINNQPNAQRQEGQLEALVAVTEDGEPSYMAQGIFNLPLLSDELAMRAALFSSSDGGYLDNIDRGTNINDFVSQGGRLAFGWNINDSLKLNASVHVQQDELDSLTRDDHAHPRYTQAGTITEPRDDEWSLTNLTIDYEWKEINFIYSISYLDRDVQSNTDLTNFMQNNFGAPIPTAVLNTLKDRNWTHEFRVNNGLDSRWSWLVGIYYQDSKAVFDQDSFAPGLDDILGGATEFFGAKDKLFVTMYDLDLEQMDVFGELSVEFSDNWRLTLGNRWYNIDQDFERSQLGLFYNGFNGLNDRSSESDTTSKISLSYLPNDETTYYVTFAEGYRPGGSNENLSGDFCLERNEAIGIETSATFKSDSLKSYELGFRKQWQSAGLFFSGAAYHVDRKDMPVTVFPECNITINVAGAESEGIELEIAYQPVDSLQLTLGLAYIDSQIDEDIPEAALAKGDPIPMVPEWSTNISATYRFDLIDHLQSVLRLNYQYIDQRTGVFGLEGFGGEVLSSYTIVDLSMKISDQQFEYTIFADNVFNKDAIYYRHENLLFSADTISRPRTVGLRINFRF